jgi:glutathione S-transferase
MMPNLTALATLVILAVYFWTIGLVGQARRRYGIEAPACTGHPVFERTFRVQMNMLEWMPLVLPAMWLAAFYVSDAAAAALGLVFAAGRVVYALSYQKAAEKRSAGFLVQAGAVSLLWIGALIGTLRLLGH